MFTGKPICRLTRLVILKHMASTFVPFCNQIRDSDHLTAVQAPVLQLATPLR